MFEEKESTLGYARINGIAPVRNMRLSAWKMKQKKKASLYFSYEKRMIYLKNPTIRAIAEILAEDKRYFAWRIN